MTKLKCQIKPKTQKFKVLSVKGLLKKADCGVPSRLAKATLKGLGLDGLTEQSAKL